MGEWLTTYRGTVFPWEVDTVGHFTVAYYFDRLADATLAALDALRLGPAYMASAGCGCITVDCHVRYLHELRAGDVLHIESAVVNVGPTGVTLGHKLFDSDTGVLCATFEQETVHRALGGREAVPLPDAERRTAQARRVAWDGPPREARPQPVAPDGFPETARDTVKPWETDVFGQSALPFYVHRFSAAGLRTFAAFGMTPAYQREQHRGFSTFEFQLRFLGALHPGDLVVVRTGVLHVGNSSIRIFHTMLRDPGGELVATLDQFGVHLDTDARRPVPLPAPLRERARAMLTETASPDPGTRGAHSGAGWPQM